MELFAHAFVLRQAQNLPGPERTRRRWTLRRR
jgi:hypothetical protein